MKRNAYIASATCLSILVLCLAMGLRRKQPTAGRPHRFVTLHVRPDGANVQDDINPVVMIAGGEATLISRFGRHTTWAGRSPAAKACRVVEIPETLLSPAPQFESGDTFAIPGLNGETHLAHVLRSASDVNGAVGTTARIAGSKHGHAFISTHHGRMLAHIELPEQGREYMIRYDAAAGKHKMAEVDRGQSLILPCGNPATSDGVTSHCKACRPSVQNELASIQQIDVMIVYTPAAADWAGSGSGIANVINIAMQRANTVHANSATDITLRLVHSAETPYTESSSASIDLNRLIYHDEYGASVDQTYMEEVPDLRDSYGADLVCLLAVRNDVGGLAPGLRNSGGTPDQAHCVVRIQQTSYTYTLAHEWGHCMGAGHSKTQSIQQGPQLYSYSAGWQWSDSSSAASVGYCTIMTYLDFDGSPGFEYNWVPHFSNPNISYTGNATGHAAEGDNARTLRGVRGVIAAYRATVVPPGNQPPVVDAGPNRTIQLPTNTTNLAGSVTDDGLPEGGVLTVGWTKQSGPGTVIFGSSASATTSASFSTVGTYVLQLTGDDTEYTRSDKVTVTVQPKPNAFPVAADQRLVVDEEDILPITLTATDSDGDELAYGILTPPGHGTLSGDPPNVTYTPGPSFIGQDSFTFRASDGTVYSNIATIYINVTSIDRNTAPVADDQEIVVQMNGSRGIQLTATDADGHWLSYAIATSPSNGSLTGTPPNVTYRPNNGFVGEDSFTFRASDGGMESEAATVNISVQKKEFPVYALYYGKDDDGGCNMGSDDALVISWSLPFLVAGIVLVILRARTREE